jgi:transposase InsO family protein
MSCQLILVRVHTNMRGPISDNSDPLMADSGRGHLRTDAPGRPLFFPIASYSSTQALHSSRPCCSANAHMESFFKKLKYEEVDLSNYETTTMCLNVNDFPISSRRCTTRNDCIRSGGTYPRRNMR